MLTPKLSEALRAVPFLATLGITVEQAQAGEVVLRLPSNEGNRGHGGTLHTGALFSVGELAAGVALGTHPRLQGLQHLIRGTSVRYQRSSTADVTARAAITDELLETILKGVQDSGRAEVSVQVTLMDGHANDVAELLVRYLLKATT
ncbi:MAG: DUF4442 domain-containing protein [Deltaproteobacteria bacterium]|nr:DUF4442 domain-containing protein [Deltaproteobacteria bacterium]